MAFKAGRRKAFFCFDILGPSASGCKIHRDDASGECDACIARADLDRAVTGWACCRCKAITGSQYSPICPRCSHYRCSQISRKTTVTIRMVR